MKKVMDVEIGGRSFVFDTDAYARLSEYLEAFRHRLSQMPSDKQEGSASEEDGIQTEVMDEVERRMAELFMKEIGSYQQTVCLNLVERVTAQLGMPDGGQEPDAPVSAPSHAPTKPLHRMYRDYDNRKMAGVCSGFAAYLNLDLTIVRIIMLILIVFGGVGLWIYVITWICAPNALTPTQKCELRGLPVTAENLTRFSESKSGK